MATGANGSETVATLNSQLIIYKYITNYITIKNSSKFKALSPLL